VKSDFVGLTKVKLKELRGLSPLENYTDWQPLVGEVSANFCGLEGASGQLTLNNHVANMV
jgi:hypothetical protein